ncbi:MAG TPA: hypothetical protein VGK61_07245 [Planctomycetota bacterium]
MRLNLPVLVGGSVIAVGLAVLILWKPERPPEDLARPAVERLRGLLRGQGKAEGRDFVIAPPILLRRAEDEIIVRLDVQLSTGEIRREYDRLRPGRDGWEFDRELTRDFQEYVDREQKAICGRLGKELANRYHGAVDIPAERVRIKAKLAEKPGDGGNPARLVGRVEIRFLDAGEGLWVEDFSLVNGQWVSEGGTLFDKGPGSP